jgi:hypothetical protein
MSEQIPLWPLVRRHIISWPLLQQANGPKPPRGRAKNAVPCSASNRCHTLDIAGGGCERNQAGLGKRPNIDLKVVGRLQWIWGDDFDSR